MNESLKDPDKWWTNALKKHPKTKIYHTNGSFSMYLFLTNPENSLRLTSTNIENAIPTKTLNSLMLFDSLIHKKVARFFSTLIFQYNLKSTSDLWFLFRELACGQDLKIINLSKLFFGKYN